MLVSFSWIPAYAGMTGWKAGVTGWDLERRGGRHEDKGGGDEGFVIPTPLSSFPHLFRHSRVGGNPAQSKSVRSTQKKSQASSTDLGERGKNSEQQMTR